MRKLICRYFSSSNNIIKSGIILERLPVITRALNKSEIEWNNFRNNNKLKRTNDISEDFGVINDNEIESFWKNAHPKISENDIIDNGDMNDESSWKPLQRVTLDDENNNIKSIYRALSERLYLIVKKPRDEYNWQFPQGSFEHNDETLRNAAEREFKEECNIDGNMNIHFLGNAPIGHTTYKANNGINNVFFFHAIYLNGKLSLDNNEVIDYAWVTKHQLKDYIQSKELLNLCNDILLE